MQPHAERRMVHICRIRSEDDYCDHAIAKAIGERLTFVTKNKVAAKSGCTGLSPAVLLAGARIYKKGSKGE